MTEPPPPLRRSAFWPLTLWPLVAGLILAVAVSLPHWAARPAERTGDFLSHVAYGWFIAFTGVVLVWRGLRTGDRNALWWAVLGGAGTTLIVGVLKSATHLPRPRDRDGHVSFDGFPSGHTTTSFALAWLLTRAFPRLAPLWYALAAAIGWSRVEGHAHFRYQVLCGAVLGTGIAWAVTEGTARVRRRGPTAARDEPG